MSAPTPIPPTAWASFRAGLRAPSLTAMLVPGLLSLAVLWALQWGTPAHLDLTRPLDALIRDEHDDYTRVAYLIGQLRARPSAGPAVYLLGGSSMRECLETEDALAAHLRAETGRAVSVHLLASSSQNLGQSLAIVDNLPPGAGVVVIGVNPGRLVRRPRADRAQVLREPIPLDSPTLMERVQAEEGPLLRLRVSRSSLRFTLEQFLPGLRRITQPARPSELRYRQHRYRQAEPRALIDKRVACEERLRRWERRLPKYGEYNARSAAALCRLARARGFTVVLMEQPWNGEIGGERAAVQFAHYRRLLGELFADPGLHYLDLNPDCGLTTEDFFDQIHLFESGRRRWQEALARALAPHVVSSAGP